MVQGCHISILDDGLHWMMSIYIWCARIMWLAALTVNWACILEYRASVSFIGKPGIASYCNSCKSLQKISGQLIIDLYGDIGIWGFSWCFHQFDFWQSTLWVWYHLNGCICGIIPYFGIYSCFNFRSYFVVASGIILETLLLIPYWIIL
jgi:hypothetical protein